MSMPPRGIEPRLQPFYFFYIHCKLRKGSVRKTGVFPQPQGRVLSIELWGLLVCNFKL